MALFSRAETSVMKDDEINAEQTTYQINSLSGGRITAEKMRKGVEEIIKSIEIARNTVHQKKKSIEDLNINLNEKRDKMENLQADLESIKNHSKIEIERLSDLEVETNNIKNAIKKIKEIDEELDPKYLEQSQNDLTNSLVEITLKAEKVQSDFNATTKREALITQKLSNAENDFNKLEEYTRNKTNETDRIISNITITIEQIIKSYEEMTAISKNLLKSTIKTEVEVKEEYSSSQYQEYNTSEKQLSMA